MNDNELHYIDVDPEELWDEMQNAYAEEGGDLLYPGDEKEMLLRAVQAIGINILMKVDSALRQDTLTYATGDALKEYGLKRYCEYMEATAATAEVTLTLRQTDMPRDLPEGTMLTADGVILWETTEDLYISGAAETIVVQIRCLTLGETGNGLELNTTMQFTEGLEGLTSAIVTQAASGGNDAEDEEAYRERIRSYGLATVTTGARMPYESMAKAVSSQILDARALNDGDDEVGIYLITATGADTASIYAAVLAALSPEDVRPLNDNVSVYGATDKAYTLNVKVWYETGKQLTQSVADTIEEYKTWQDNTIGRAFNPEKLSAMLYQSGCERVQFTTGSSGIDGGSVEYTEISERARCKGTITPTIVNT